jgi:putative heme-binding domain-containing protein
MALAERWTVAGPLSEHAGDAEDRCVPLLIWYGVEPAVPGNQAAALSLAARSRIPKLRRFIARRLAEDDDDPQAGLEAVVGLLGRVETPEVQLDLLQGVRDGLKGRKQVKTPAAWTAVEGKLAASTVQQVGEVTRMVALLLNAPGAPAALLQIVADPSAPVPQRAAALHAMIDKGSPELVPVLLELLKEPPLRGEALRGLAAFPDEGTPKAILRLYSSLNAAEKQDAITTLAARPHSALALLEAIAGRTIPRGDLSVFTARQIQDLGDAHVSEKLNTVWGQLRQPAADKKAAIGKYKAMLTSDTLARADLPNGRVVFNRVCAQCHTLYGVGSTIGPDLTGSNRSDLHYVLENTIDPSAVVGRDYQLTNVLLRDGRLLAGIIIEETNHAVTVQTANERRVVSKADIEQRRVAPLSMMPEGLLDQLPLHELRDLVAYLATKQQVPLAK